MFHTFSTGQTYTALAADEWGNVVILHFRLSSSSSTSSISSSFCTSSGAGSAYVKVVSFSGPPVQYMTLTVTYTGPEVAGNFYCGGTSFEIRDYSSSQGYVEISGEDGFPVAGQYDVQFSYNGVDYGAGLYIENASVSTYTLIELPSLGISTITCSPGASCSATATNTASCSSSSLSSSNSSQGITNILIPSGLQTSGFEPSAVHVVIGVNNTVTWTDDSAAPMSMTSTDVGVCGPTFDSGILQQGHEFTVTFSAPGTYRYDSVFDTEVVGTIVVTQQPP